MPRRVVPPAIRAARRTGCCTAPPALAAELHRSRSAVIRRRSLGSSSCARTKAERHRWNAKPAASRPSQADRTGTSSLPIVHGRQRKRRSGRKASVPSEPAATTSETPPRYQFRPTRAGYSQSQPLRARSGKILPISTPGFSRRLAGRPAPRRPAFRPTSSAASKTSSGFSGGFVGIVDARKPLELPSPRLSCTGPWDPALRRPRSGHRRRFRRNRRRPAPPGRDRGRPDRG